MAKSFVQNAEGLWVPKSAIAPAVPARKKSRIEILTDAHMRVVTPLADDLKVDGDDFVGIQLIKARAASPQGAALIHETSETMSAIREDFRKDRDVV